MVCAAARRLHEYLGRRGRFLSLIGVGKACYGAGLVADTTTVRGLELLARVAPISTWAWLWIAAGAVTFASAFLRVGRDSLGFIAALIPPTVWATSHMVSVLNGDFGRGGYLAVWFLTSHVGVILWAATVPEHSVPPPPRRSRKGATP